MEHIHSFRGPADVAAAGGILAALFADLPSILSIVAGVLGVVWYGVLLYDRFTKGVNSDKGHE